MSIERHEQNKIFSKVVEANGFVITSGIVADDSSKGIAGQTREVLAEIDRLLGLCGTDKSKAVSTMIWITDIRNRDAMNEVWFEWTGGQNMPVRACVEARLANPD
ncbi:MAG: RidA family protein, partial [Alphaproteobacteria bacterium]|nr:RidA family protein [Alphaproteobacteria bacterium]